MRYFLINFSAIPASGNIWMRYEKFPSNIKMLEYIQATHHNAKLTSIVITNIFEFKSEQDYQDFIAKD